MKILLSPAPNAFRGMSKVTKTSKLELVFNYKMLLVIAGLAVAFQILNWIIPEQSGEFNPIDLSSTASVVVCAVLSFIVARKYSGSEALGQAYLSLAIGFSLWAIGDFIWYYYDIVLKLDPYPSLADIFYLAYYPFVIFHLVRNITFFKRKIDAQTKIWLAAIPIAITLAYTYFSFQQNGEAHFDFYFGLPYVLGAGISLSFAILGSQVFRHSVLAAVWSLLAIGIFLTAFADVYYYYLEIFGLYTRSSIVTARWLASSMVITYALYRHHRII